MLNEWFCLVIFFIDTYWTARYTKWCSIPLCMAILIPRVSSTPVIQAYLNYMLTIPEAFQVRCGVSYMSAWGLISQKCTVACRSVEGVLLMTSWMPRELPWFSLALLLLAAAETASTGLCSNTFLFSCLCFMTVLQLIYYEQGNIYLEKKWKVIKHKYLTYSGVSSVLLRPLIS